MNRNLKTEDEAAETWCPAQAINFAMLMAAAREDDGLIESMSELKPVCAGSRCAMWRWSDDTRGNCGLAAPLA